jgi:hypothetical protein
VPESLANSPEVGDDSREMTVLEHRYRGWLRLLPKDYRAQWEDDMVDTFLAGALSDADEEERELAGYGTPSFAEVTSVLSLAVRLRLGTTERAPRPLLWRAAWRRVALIGLLVNTIWVTVSLPAALWLAGLLPGIDAPVDQSQGPVDDRVTSLEVIVAGWWHSYWGLSGLATAAAYIALVHSRRRTAAVLAVAGVLPGLVDRIQFWIVDGPAFMAAQLTHISVDLLPVIALVAYVGETAPVHRRPWLWAWPAGVAVLTGLSFLAWSPSLGILMDPTGLYCLALALGGATYLTAVRHQPADPAWSLTLAILSVVVLVNRLASLSPFWFGDSATDETTLRLMRSSVVEAGLVAAVALIFGARATRAVRRLPVVVKR